MKKIKAKLAAMNQIIEGSDAYWNAQHELTEAIRLYLQTEFCITRLNKKDLLFLCHLVSRYRPRDTWQFLLQVSSQYISLYGEP